MNNEQRQRLSAMVDDAAGPGQAAAMLSAVEHSPDLRGCWQRYHLIGQLLRGEPLARDYCAIADRVRAAVANERRPEPVSLLGRLRRRLASMQQRPGLLLPAYGGAAAVVLALGVVVLGLLPSDDRAGPGRAQLAAVDDASAGDPGLAAASSMMPPPRWQAASPALSSKLDRMLVGHRESASASGIKGFIPYAAVVGNGAR